MAKPKNVIKKIKTATRRKFSADEKIRIVRDNHKKARKAGF